ncbi:hypothetical protein RvY_05828 [Ramazzottius varieornatus]|uniref:Phosducin domain-containing protein n=1 Tax=Ramazzottius varieornatus TaxID=947166 RepID=A0A1D1V633_RAMVA|nr:hypothetical protein RvY_05828 [Ramazzottius varieornatus]
MTTLEDKILGEKKQCYCSSSEDEDDKKDEGDGDEPQDGSATSARSNKLKFIPEKVVREWEGYSTNTGPKGVIRDWQRFKQLETEKKQQQDQERITLANKLSTTCRSHLDDEKEKKKQAEKDEALATEPESEDEILKEYLEKRMQELMSSKIRSVSVFGAVHELDSVDAFLENTEKGPKGSLVVVLLYEDKAAGCSSMKNCMKYLASEYSNVKFCQIKSSLLNVSSRFRSVGLPALQAYKNGELIGNYVQLVKEFGDEIYGSDVESFLIEHGILQDKSLVPSILRSKTQLASHEDDSD